MSNLNHFELVRLVRMALAGLPHAEKLSRTYGDFQTHLEDLEDDLRRGCHPSELITPLKPARTRCSCR